MSSGKKFFLIVAAILIPFMLVFGIVLGVLIARSGGEKTNYTYAEDKSMITSSDTSVATPAPSASTSSIHVDKKSLIIGRWVNKTTGDGLPVPNIKANDITRGWAESFGEVNDYDSFETMEFFEDGTLNVQRYIACKSIEDGGRHYWAEDVGNGTYSLSDDFRLRLSYKIGKSNVADVLNVELSDLELVLYDDSSEYKEVFSKLN